VNAGELGHVHTVDVNRFVDGDRECSHLSGS
jgi:hypothetical protein